ncbi:MAG: sulfatase-like hydrolase/transferase [Kiritimatiellales bacterium]
MKRHVIEGLFAAGIFSMAGGAVSAQEKKPNIIVIFTDDQGWADLGIHGAVDDIRTPHLDQLARDGALCTSGYVTAPQCAPSRAGLMTGKYQQRFGFDHIPDGPLRLEEITVAERLNDAGYTTGMVGKWHLEPNHTCVTWGREVCPDKVDGNKVIPPGELVMKYFPEHQGFDEYFKGEIQRYWINYGLDGKNRARNGEWITIPEFRIDTQTKAALSFIDRNKSKPFFLYLAYFAPHVPLEASKKYLDRFPGEMPERRRYALAMMSAVDDGVGEIRKKLTDYRIDRNTLIFYIADNGAPLKIDMEDLPVSVPHGAWDGSMNVPWVGEKGMLMEGGIRVPYIVTWPEKIPVGTVISDPVISLDMAATAVAAAGLPPVEEFDGIDLIPHLRAGAVPERDLCWRFWQQSAIRRGKWKYLRLTDGREFLYDMDNDVHEKENLVSQYPEKAGQLRAAWLNWAQGMRPAGFPAGKMNDQEVLWYNHYLNLKKDVQ